MAAAVYALTVFQGDDFSITLRLRLPDNSYEDLTGKVAKSQIRPTPGSETLLAEFAAAIPDQSVPANLGMITLSLTGAQTALLPAAAAVWDVQTSNGDGTGVRTRVKGAVTVEAQVTRP